MNIDDLRSEMMDTIRQVKAGTLKVEVAQAVSDLSQVMINSAKVEVDFIRVNGGGMSSFISATPAKQITQTPTGLKIVEGNVTIHKLKK